MVEMFAGLFPKVIKTHHNQHLSSLTSYHIHICLIRTKQDAEQKRVLIVSTIRNK